MVIDGSPCSKQRFRHEMPREYGRRNGLYEKWPVLAMNGLIGRSSGTAEMVRIPINGLAMSAFRMGNDRYREKQIFPVTVGDWV
jgi:hypothetical protein